MNVIGFSGLANSIPFKRKEFPGLTEREYNIVQGLDAAVALLGDKGIIAAAAEERFTRLKATGAFPLNAFKYCLAAGNLQPADVDVVAHGFSYESHKALFQGDDYAKRQYAEVFSPEVQRRLLKEHFGSGRWDEKFVAIPHHLAHAVSAFYPSGFEEALILVSDGMGEMESMTVAVGQGKDIRVLTHVPAFHSLGALYGVFSLYLGFFMNSDEYKVMGLAPYGNSRRYFDKLMEFVSLKEDGTYTLPIFAHNQTLEERETHRGVLRFLVEQFGPSREAESEITQAHKDLAASLQAMLQTIQLHVLRHFKRETGLKNLCMAGGVALNCSANGVIKRSELFKKVFVEPASGDDGSALGAALYASRLHDTNFKPKRMGVPLWGPQFSEAEILKAAEQRTDCDVIELDSFGEVCNEVTDRLKRGEIIAWFQDRMEFGPRALGSRSILADPRDPTMRDKINALVKKREGFRPFAPVVKREAAAEIFEIPPGDEEAFAHMLFVTHVRPEYRDKLPATTHVDGSARVQTVAQQDNPKLWQLLNTFAETTGMPVLLNTSFNVRGQPIVCTPEEAIDTFLKARLDALVLGNLILLPRKHEVIDPAKTEEHRKQLEEAASRHEEFWVNRLSGLEPVSVPLKRKELTGANVENPAPIKFSLSKEHLKNFGEETNPEVLWLAALSVWLARTTGMQSFDLSFTDANLHEKTRGLESIFATAVPLHLDINLKGTFAEMLSDLREELGKIRARRTYALDLPLRHPALKSSSGVSLKLPVGVRIGRNGDVSQRLDSTEITLLLGDSSETASLAYDSNLLDEETVSNLGQKLATLLQNLSANPESPLTQVSLLSEAERNRVLFEWNNTKRADVPHVCMHDVFAEQVKKTPNAIALAFREQELTYAELDRRATMVAAHLKTLGVRPDTMVAVCTEVCIEMMVGLLGVLKAGGAYVPLDPHYPADRIAFMLEDSQAPVLLTQKALVDKLPATGAKVVCLEDFNFDAATNGAETKLPATEQDPSSLAYVIYTSGSTGKPKGVMITHANVVNFFTGMDERVGVDPVGVWLAVTSISFDISVLELFWTLVRGFKVVLQSRETRPSGSVATTRARNDKPMDFSLFYFASDESASGAEKYRLLLEGAKFADEHGFAAVWTPERHFHAFGGLYPNPSVTSAAVAAITSKVQIRAGSVVLPLHNPIRVAEEWSVVDNISNGRVGISFASGWQVNDFALAPEKFSRRKEAMLEGIEQLRKMWRGETFEYRTPKGDATQLKVLPRPVQRELPIWLTASGNPDTFKQAGQIGANVLTHLLGQSLDELKQKISVYRAARKEAGHEGPGMVTLMLHTFVGESLESVKETVRKPFTNYLRSSIDLIKNDPWAFSTFKPAPKTNGNSHLNGNGNGAATWNDEERDAMAAHAFNRYFETSGLFGTPERCVEMVNKLQGLGVDEVACLIDFGVSEDKVLASLHKLNKVRESTMDTNAAPEPAQYSIPAQMVRHGVTHLQCTPSMASMLLEDPDATVALGSLKKLLLGGEALPLALIQHLDTKAEILNMYGPTETTIWSATDVVNKAENKVTIGRPIANTEIYIVDKSMQPTPAGIPGELLIGGAGVVRGYLHRPELTAEKFIPNTFNPAPGARLYRTGDLARHLPDGRVEFLGRLDHQVKLRGFRIELGEIETVISRHPSIKECVAIVREDVPGDKRLVAYVLPASAMGIEASALRDHSRESLPEYMVPSAFVPLTAFPLTPNGKVDRKALPAPSFKKAARAAAPTGSLTEQKVAEVYRELLGVEVSSFQDNFFELGGNSLLATQLITRLREAFKWQLPLRLAFEHPTVESLAAAISTGNQDSPDTAHAPETIEVAERNGPLPLSFAQQRIWFLHQLEPGSHYNDHFDLRLTGPVNTTVLERAINEIVRRHDALRSIFLKGEVGPVLQILPEVRLSMKLTDLSGLPFETREKEAIKLAVHDCQQPFDLETGPLLRAGLVKLHDTDHLLVLTFDHIVIDGWSHGVFLTELTAIYEAFLAGKPSPLPPLAVQYTDYAGWQQDWFQGKNIEPHLAYWRQQLANAPALLELPTDHPRPIEESFSGARHFLELEKPLVDGLAAVGRKENCTLFMVFLAAFQTLLAKYTEREDIIIGSPIANRNRAETEALIGSFMNTVVLRTNLSGDPEFKQLLHRVRKMSLDSYAHQDLPFEQLVADLQPTRNLGYSPVFQVMFILQNTPMPRANVGKLSFQHFDVDAGTSKLDITINLEETKDGAVGWIEYATDLFEAESIKNMAAHFKELLQNIVAAPQERLSKLRLAPKGAEWRFPAGLGNSSRRLSDRTEDPGKVQSTASASNSLGIPTLDLKPAVTASLTPVQKDLAAIWSDVLGIQDVAVDDNLFDLGGHSLLITRIISRIRKTFSVEIPIHTFFETPTLGGIATAIEAEQAKGTSQKAAEPRIQKLARR